MSAVVLRTENLVKRFGGLIATQNVTFELNANELHAVIGPNGAGKTTLLAQLSGELRPSSGRILYREEEVTRLSMPMRAQRGIVRSFQITSICKEFTALDNVILAAQAHEGHSFRFFGFTRRDPSLVASAIAFLERVGLSERRHVLAGLLSHGEQRHLEVAIALALKPQVLLLDEPMAGMGGGESQKMIELLLELKGRYAILLIEHDMDAVFALADRISVLVYGRVIATGAPSEIRANAEVRRAYLGDEVDRRLAG